MTLIIYGIACVITIYSLFTKSYKQGLVLFLVYTSCIEGPLKIMTTGMPIKMLVYIMRDLILYILFIRAVLSHYFEDERAAKGLPRPQFVNFVIFYFIWCAMMIFHPKGLNLLNSVAGLRIHIEMIPLFFFGYYLMNSKKDFGSLFWICIVCAVLNSVASLLQVINGLEWLRAIHPGYGLWADNLGRGIKLGSGLESMRPPGLGSDMGFAGRYAVFVFPMIIVLFSFLKKEFHKILLLCIFVFLILGVFSSQSRTAYVLTFIVIVITFFVLNRAEKVKRRMGIAIVIVITVIIGLSLTYNYFPHLTKRFETVKTMGETLKTITEKESVRSFQVTSLILYMARDHFLGNGLGKVGPGRGIFAKGVEYGELNAENQITLGIAEVGVPGVLLLFLFHLNVYLFGRKAYKTVKESEWQLYLAVPIIIIALQFIFWPFENLIIFPNNAYFWFFCGVLVRYRAFAAQNNVQHGDMREIV